MTRFMSATLLFVGLVSSICAEDGFRPQFEFGTSVTIGSAFEYVFDETLGRGGFSNPLSRLSWPIPPSIAADFSATLPWTAWTSTTAALSAAIPVVTGTLIDEDWNAGNLVYGHSEHTALMTSNLSGRIEQSFHFGKLTLSAGGIYRWMTWEGWNGSGTYQYTTGTTQETFTGPLIAYRQQWIIPYVGARWTWDCRGGWWIIPSARFGPYSWCSDRDDHNYVQTASSFTNDGVPKTFLDNMSGGYYLQGSFEVLIPGGVGWQWGVRCSGEMTHGAIGDTTETKPLSGANPPVYPVTTNSAGAWFQEASLTVFVRN